MYRLLFFTIFFIQKNTEKLSSVFFVSSLLGLDVNSYFFKAKKIPVIRQVNGFA